MRKTKRSKIKRSKTKRRNRKHNYLGKARIKYYSIKKGGEGPYSNRSIRPRSNRSATHRSNRSITPRSNRSVKRGRAIANEKAEADKQRLHAERKAIADEKAEADKQRLHAEMLKKGANSIEELIKIEAAERKALADEKAAVGPIPMREPDYVVDNKDTDEAFMKRVKSAALKRKRAMSTVEKKADKLRLHAEMKKRGANSEEDLNKIYAAENAARAAEKAAMLAQAKKAADNERWATFKDAMISLSTPYNKEGYKSIYDE
jgi:hypothetical protein